MAHTLNKDSLDQAIREAKVLEEVTGVLRKHNCTRKEAVGLLRETSKMLKKIG